MEASVSALPSPRATRTRVSISIIWRARTGHFRRFLDSLFFTFVADVGPEAVQLPPADLVVRHQGLLDGFCVLGGIAEPVQDGVFLMPFDPRQAAHADAFGHKC